MMIHDMTCSSAMYAAYFVYYIVASIVAPLIAPVVAMAMHHPYVCKHRAVIHGIPQYDQ